MVKRQDITPSVMRKVRARTMMRDQKLHGTATLFVALDVLDGSVLGRRRQRPRHQAFSSGSSTPNTPWLLTA